MRKLISFNEDIVNKAFDSLNGKYSKDQIKEVLDASISYYNYLMKYTNTLYVKIPMMGMVSVDLQGLKHRKYMLDKTKEKNKKFTLIESMEYKSIVKRISIIEDMLFRNECDPRLLRNYKAYQNLIHGKENYYRLQLIQNKQFNSVV